MDTAVARRLLRLNEEFYERLAEPFSATRGRLQPGVMRILENVPADANVLDLGCGNGRVAMELARRNHRGRYVGVDFSAGLLQEAQKKVQGLASHIEFVQADLIAEFDQHPAIQNRKFDWIFAFAALHHIPSEGLRLGFLRRVKSLLAPPGHFTFSVWQFLNSERLTERIQPWSSIGLQEADIDRGDYLLDWRSQEQGLRYVHHFSEDELTSLAAQAGFTIAEKFYSDGENRKLGLYETWNSQ